LKLQPLEHVGLFADGAAVRADLHLSLSIYIYINRSMYGRLQPLEHVGLFADGAAVRVYLHI